MKKRIFALVLTVLFIVAAVPVAGVGETPEGYDEHDYWKIRNFLEIADENNIKNGNKISENYSPYDPHHMDRYRQQRLFDGMRMDFGRTFAFGILPSLRCRW